MGCQPRRSSLGTHCSSTRFIPRIRTPASASMCSRRRWRSPASPPHRRPTGTFATGTKTFCRGRLRPGRSRRSWESRCTSRSPIARTSLPAGIALAAPRSCWAGCTSYRVPRKRRRTPTPSPSATACSFGRRFCATSPTAHSCSTYRADFRRPYRDDPPPRRDLLPRRSFLTTHKPHRHPRLPQPLRLLLSLDQGAAHALSRARRRAGRRRVPGRRPAVRRLRRQQPRLTARVLAAPLPRAAAAGEDLERRGEHRRDRRPQPRPRNGPAPAARASSSGSNRCRTTTSQPQARRVRPPRTTPTASRYFIATASRSTAASSSGSTTIGPKCSKPR